MNHPRASDGHIAVVPKLPRCDFCGVQAHYDAKTKFGPWANMCEDHWSKNAESKLLGVGRGQRLVVKRDI